MKNPYTPRILLTGPTGQIGSKLLKKLPSIGRVISVPEPSMETPPEVMQCSGGLSLNLAHADDIVRVVREVKPDLIVNTGAYTAVDRAESDPATARAVNAEAPGILAEEAKRCGAAIVHYSTDYVFDGSSSEPYRESSPTGTPLNVYGQTKLEGERAIQSVGVPHLILRTEWVYSLHGSNFLKTILRLIAERTELRVVCDQIGTPNAAHVVADHTCQILSKADGKFSPFLQEKGGILHLCCDGETSWHGFAQEILRLARERDFPIKTTSVIPISSEEFPVPAKRPLNSRLDNSRLKSVFSIYPPKWQDALTSVFSEIRCQ